jgi:hypothetical protein
MNTSKSKPLAKVFGPVLLLSAALALPVDSYAAPSPRERNAHADKADKNEKKANRAERQKRNQQQDEVRQERSQARSNTRNNKGQERRAEAQRQADLNRQRAAERQAASQRAEVRRQAELKKQNENSRRARQLQESRQAELNRQAAIQRQAELNRRAELQRQAELNRRTELQRRADLQRRTELQRRSNAQRYAFPRNRFYDRSNNRYQNYAGGRSWNRGDTIAVDGYLTNEGYRCQALRDDNGDLYMLVGNTYGLRTGDHARVVGRVVDGGYCDWEGTAFEITDVTALWADRRHQAVYYHQNYDGGRFGDRDNWMGRRPRAFYNRIER